MGVRGRCGVGRTANKDSHVYSDDDVLAGMMIGEKMVVRIQLRIPSEKELIG